MTIAEQFAARLENEAEVGEFRGFRLKLRRLRAKMLYAQGRLPGYFASAYRKANGVAEEEFDPANQLRKEEFDQSAQFELDVIVDCCLEPRLKRTPEDEGDVLIDDVPDNVLTFIYGYATRIMDFPNEEKKDEVTAETLSTFLHDGTGPDEPGDTGERGEALRTTPVGDVGAGTDAAHSGVAGA